MAFHYVWSHSVELGQMSYPDKILVKSLDMGSANEKRHYSVTSFLIGWAHTHNNPWEGLAVENNSTFLGSIGPLRKISQGSH